MLCQCPRCFVIFPSHLICSFFCTAGWSKSGKVHPNKNNPTDTNIVATTLMAPNPNNVYVIYTLNTVIKTNIELIKCPCLLIITTLVRSII